MALPIPPNRKHNKKAYARIQAGNKGDDNEITVEEAMSEVGDAFSELKGTFSPAVMVIVMILVALICTVAIGNMIGSMIRWMFM